MSTQLYTYYEEELAFIRRMAGDFAQKYPDVAKDLLLGPTRSPDPHVERLIEAFAMIAARIHLKLDDGFPELTDALLGMICPHYLVPIPSLTVAEFTVDAQQGQVEGGVPIARGSTLFTKPYKDVRCRFRTSMDLRLWPLNVTQVDRPAVTTEDLAFGKETKSVIRIRLETMSGEPCSEYDFQQLCFYLGEQPISYKLHEALFSDGIGVLVKQDGKTVGKIPATRLRPMGFAEDERLLDTPPGVASGYRLLQEYFAFPQKFLFAAIEGIDRRWFSETDSSFELWILLSKQWSDLDGGSDSGEADHRIGVDNFKLGCVPAVNQFPHECSPIRIDHRHVEYKVNPDRRSQDSYEVLSIESVASTAQGATEAHEFRPFYALRHGDAPDEDIGFWHTTRKEANRKDDDGSDVWISLVDPGFKPTSLEGYEVLHVRALCSNRDLPPRLMLGDPNGDFHVEGLAEVSRIKSLIAKPTTPQRPSLRGESRWRLVSHLSLNHLSLVSSGGIDGDPERAQAARTAFREILKLYDFAQSEETARRIEGLVGIDSRRITRVLPDTGPVRGVQVELEFDEVKYVGSGVFLFASVLEHFLSLYTTLNSFTVTSARLQSRDKPFKQWPPRTGAKQIL